MGTLGITTTGSELLGVSDRDRILRALAECCAERGFAETEIEDVLERAGVSRVSFDSHFASKEDCASAAFNKLVSDTLAALSMAGAPAADMAAAAKAVLEIVSAEPAFGYLGLVGFRQGGTQRMRDAYESAARVLSLMMERAHPRPGGGGLSYTQTRAAVGGAEALLRRELAAGRAANLPSLLPDFVYAALVPFVGQGEALRQAREAARWAAEEGR
jgi:AcrR family transcriptional regulator